jgi:hypothetical protein
MLSVDDGCTVQKQLSVANFVCLLIIDMHYQSATGPMTVARPKLA